MSWVISGPGSITNSEAPHSASVLSRARRISMARRQVVESANSALKGALADLGRGFFCVMGLVKTTVLLGFTLAAYNLDRIRSNKGQARTGR
jgi:hypothetical protein